VFEIAAILDWEQSRTDGRGAFVVLTDAGRAAIEQAAPTHVNTVRGLVFDGLSPDQVAALTAITAQVLERLHTQPAELTSGLASRGDRLTDLTRGRAYDRDSAPPPNSTELGTTRQRSTAGARPSST
jgi:hypothetical protein